MNETNTLNGVAGTRQNNAIFYPDVPEYDNELFQIQCKTGPLYKFRLERVNKISQICTGLVKQVTHTFLETLLC